jgi:hypothetical protein
MATGLRNAEKRGFKHSFSAYVTWLIERDAAGNVQREDIGIYRRRARKEPELKAPTAARRTRSTEKSNSDP